MMASLVGAPASARRCPAAQGMAKCPQCQEVQRTAYVQPSARYTLQHHNTIEKLTFVVGVQPRLGRAP